ncbi:biotin transporter BioY [Rhodococcus sp. ACS1]|uniref:Biotin transporter n=3 Tax=Rhodococcus TaxID=1827 RepID=A0A1H4RP61_9NOCA|nr:MULTISPECIES: biotin transporter BioY [Rhodococcus]MBV6761343.1 biotin transporter BioY [Rhodococcus opacus]MDF3305559.1 biotin transporter BioY [Rhodococcus sp. T2V]PBC46878.1 biotin transporter BioY [Rhodococcus sp. ACS1]QSE82870.1 biotin transporter BioY [Rhodococcus koreensis]QSE89972.1 biotin transporter BioY [Rhodococcus pseudokoreensis]
MTEVGSARVSRLGISARDMAQIAVFAALIAALGLPGAITVGFSGVPITLQTLGVILAGAVLGARKGTAAVAVFLALTLIGLPLLSGGRTGLTALAGPSAGYLIGWLPATLVIGLLTARILPKYPIALGLLINALGGIVIIYLFGTIGLLLRTDLGVGAAITTNFAFIPGDALKVVVATVVAKSVHRAYPGLIRT